MHKPTDVPEVGHCEVGFGTAKPCFATCKEVQWNAKCGFWYCAD